VNLSDINLQLLNLVVAYQYVDESSEPPSLVRFEMDRDNAREDHPEYHMHLQPCCLGDVRFPTGHVTLEQVLDMIFHQLKATP